MKRVLLFAVLVAGILAIPGAAEAQTACFDWYCNPGTRQCDFDATCSAGPDNPIVYEWTWGDGSSTEYTFDEMISHTYGGSSAFFTVNLNVGYLFIGYDDVTCRIQIRNVLGFPLPSYSGTCS
jgi:hypothetical protein